MKKILILPIYYLISCLCIPFVTTLFMPKETPSLSTNEPTVEDESVSVYNHLTNTTANINMDEYLIGVVAAEMPAAFEPEALKAQAVAARTYTLYKAKSNDHTADVCTDFSHCQAYLNESEMRNNWGNDYDFYFNKIKDAVFNTKGEYIVYNNEPAMAVFHSMGGGRTENSSDVWGEKVPYLVSVPSPGEESATNYNSTVEITFDNFKNTLKQKYPDIEVSSYLDISEPTLTEGGHVKTILIGSIPVSGTTLRSLFNLRSTKFNLSFSGENVIFSVTGYGHGVGMSQYGANAMAKTGKTYKEILSHYYQGTSLTE